MNRNLRHGRVCRHLDIATTAKNAAAASAPITTVTQIEGATPIPASDTDMASGATADINKQGLVPHATSRITVLGSKGSLVAEATLLLQRPGGRLVRESGEGLKVIPFSYNDPYVGTIRTFLDAIETGCQPFGDWNRWSAFHSSRRGNQEINCGKNSRQDRDRRQRACSCLRERRKAWAKNYALPDDSRTPERYPNVAEDSNEIRTLTISDAL